MSLRPVLFITYNFPPHGGAGVQRVLKFVKYLPQFSWQPIVITAQADASSVQDSSLLSDVPLNTPIFRVPGFSIAQLQARAKTYGLGKLVTLLNLLLQIPDPHRFWAGNTRRTITKIIQNEKPRLVYTTSGPYSNHLVGMWVRHRFQIPWFADFRDPWSQNLLTPYLPGYRALNKRLERRVLAIADRVACVSKPWLDQLGQNLGQQPDKFMVLPNGYDEQDVQPLPLPAPTEKFTLTHLGSFYYNRRPDKLIEAVEILTGSGRIAPSELRVLFIGKNSAQYIPDKPPFEIHGYMPHKDLDHFRLMTNVFLLILATSPDNAGNHSGKLFEYLASNRPILGIVPPGGVAEALIQETRTGITVDGDVQAIAGAIENLYRQWKSGSAPWNPNWDVIRQYTRRNLTARLAAEFDRLVNSEMPA